MLTKLTVRNFKQFESAEIELGNPVVFVGPNNSGKTTALQALALWEVGLRKWREKRAGKSAAAQRPGVAINRRDLNAIPVPAANLLWRDPHVRDVRRQPDGKPDTRNIRIDIKVEGVAESCHWVCGLEFDYANDESFHCRPLRLSEDKPPRRMEIPVETENVRVAFLPPMSGLSEQEFFKQPGEIDFLIGQGRTAEVLRNLCWQVFHSQPDGGERWGELTERIHALFGVTLEEPVYISERSEIVLTYRDRSSVRLDISAGGRGLHQTLLLLAYLSAHSGAVLLLDEPDAHLEILRQREIYQTLSQASRRHGSQIIVASHSEVLLREAAERDVVVAFLGRPHRVNDSGSQLLKSLRDIGFEDYYLARQKGWVLHLEGSTDLAILKAWADTLEHPAAAALERVFAHYVGNHPGNARNHFHGLREAAPGLIGFLLCDRQDRPLQSATGLEERMWSRREIENYLCHPKTLRAYAEGSASAASPGPLFEPGIARERARIMDECLRDLVPPVALRDPNDPYWNDARVSDELLSRLFAAFYEKLGLPNLMLKTNYHELARFMPKERIPAEVTEVLDAIQAVAERAAPLAED